MNPRVAETDDETLVRRFLSANDSASFEQLVERYRDGVQRHVLGVLGPEGARDAADVTQEVFIRLYFKLSAFRFESQFHTWLFRLVRNCALDHRRKMAARGLLRDDQPSHPLGAMGVPSPFRSTVRAEQSRRLARMINRLPQTHRSAIYLHYWLGLSTREIASDLGVAKGTVQSYLHRARAKLRRILHGQEENYIERNL